MGGCVSAGHALGQVSLTWLEMKLKAAAGMPAELASLQLVTRVDKQGVWRSRSRIGRQGLAACRV